MVKVAARGVTPRSSIIWLVIVQTVHSEQQFFFAVVAVPLLITLIILNSEDKALRKTVAITREFESSLKRSCCQFS